VAAEEVVVAEAVVAVVSVHLAAVVVAVAVLNRPVVEAVDADVAVLADVVVEEAPEVAV